MSSFSHQTEIRVTYADTDAMGIVYYANYLRWFEIGRTELMRSLGVAYKDLEGEEVHLPVSEVSCKYLQSARYDDVLMVETRVDFLKRASMQFHYRLWRKADGAELVSGTTLHAFVDGKGKIIRVPAFLREKLPAPESKKNFIAKRNDLV